MLYTHSPHFQVTSQSSIDTNLPALCEQLTLAMRLLDSCLLSSPIRKPHLHLPMLHLLFHSLSPRFPRHFRHFRNRLLSQDPCPRSLPHIHVTRVRIHRNNHHNSKFPMVVHTPLNQHIPQILFLLRITEMAMLDKIAVVLHLVLCHFRLLLQPLVWEQRRRS